MAAPPTVSSPSTSAKHQEIDNTVSADDVVSPNFYIKKWLPYDYTTSALMIHEVLLIKRFLDKTEKFTSNDFSGIDLKGAYEEKVNAAYCYSIAFTMLHELSHFELGHLDTNDEKMEDEENADLNAFWSVFCDLDKAEKFTPVVGILCLLFALLMLNPALEEDGDHPREDCRIFEIYDNVVSDNPKYTVLLVRLYNLWANTYGIEGYTSIKDDSEGSLVQIRNFLNSKKNCVISY